MLNDPRWPALLMLIGIVALGIVVQWLETKGRQ